MAKALYRTYRSKSLDELVGQQQVTDVLKEVIKAKRFSHAYLLTGPRGTGKTSVARILAHAINELPYTDDTTHLDIIEIDAASNRRIDDIRELRDRIHIAPVSAPYKIYIIDEVHMLTSESFNALLKTLEEPPEHAIFILATTELHKLPATIVSRTQRYHFRLIEQADMIRHLRTIADKEKITISDEALQLIAEHGDGAFRDSISLLDQLASVGKGKIDANLVESTLGLAPHTLIDTLVSALIHRDSPTVRDQLQMVDERGIPVAVVTQQLLRALTSSAASQPELYHLIDQLIDVPRAFDPRLKLLTTLLLFCTQHTSAKKPDSRAVVVSAPASIISAPLPPAKKSEKVTNKALAVQPSGNLPAASSSLQLTADQWASILSHVKKTTPPLYSVLKNAHAGLDQPGTVTLQCGFALHAKKLEDAKYRSQLAAAITEICGTCPAIMITHDKSLVGKSPVIVAIPSEADGQTASVIAMMGGGEIVDAPKTAPASDA